MAKTTPVKKVGPRKTSPPRKLAGYAPVQGKPAPRSMPVVSTDIEFITAAGGRNALSLPDEQGNDENSDVVISGGKPVARLPLGGACAGSLVIYSYCAAASSCATARFLLLTCVVMLTGVLAAAQTPPVEITGGDKIVITRDATDGHLIGWKDKKPADDKASINSVAAVDTKTFTVGPEDVLRLEVWDDTSFSGLYTVHTDGAITLPLIGDIEVGGLTHLEIEALIIKALSKYMLKPLVTVNVQAVFSRKYYIDGQVGRAGEFSLQSPTTVLEALSKAGGFRDFANLKKVYILRGDKRIPFNYKEVIHGKNLSQNIPLEPGDHIIVP
jgi:polysaccharide biosynthesis/export protein